MPWRAAMVEPTRGVGLCVVVEDDDDGEAFRLRGSFCEAEKT